MGDLSEAQWRVPRLAIVNPVAWELGHVGWFAEFWCLRWAGEGRPLRDSLLAGSDSWYDSSRVAHENRWQLELPPRSVILAYLEAVLDATLETLARADEGDAGLYNFSLALAHELMHGEAFVYTRQTCAYPAPSGSAASRAGGCSGDAAMPAQTINIGAGPGPGFVFDNEKWAHPVEFEPYSISRAPVSAGEFEAFVAAGGYWHDEFWCEAGRRWRDEAGARQPVYWRRSGSGWQQRVFDAWRPLDPVAPMVHVSAFEAQAWCRWAGRRLPSEAEWEGAARAGAISWGEVWEWTADPFAPYPGFAPDPYRDYSLPWFHSHRAVRGASWATSPWLRDAAYRNYYLPERNDLLIGFRTCSL